MSVLEKPEKDATSLLSVEQDVKLSPGGGIGWCYTRRQTLCMSMAMAGVCSVLFTDIHLRKVVECHRSGLNKLKHNFFHF